MLKGLVDSHAHLDLGGDAAGTVAAAARHGVKHIITVGIDLKSSRLAAALADKYPSVNAAVGIHPHNAGEVTDETLAGLRDLARLSQVVAVGETGLDFYRDRSPRKAQEQAFLRHIELARHAGKPLMVHCREAAARTLDILGEHAGDLTVIMHCFSLHDHVEECAGRGYFMSLAGNVTFSNARALRLAAAVIPANLVLTETDSPYLSPAPGRGEPNSPENIRFIVAELARLRKVSEESLAEQVRDNFFSAFKV